MAVILVTYFFLFAINSTMYAVFALITSRNVSEGTNNLITKPTGTTGAVMAISHCHFLVKQNRGFTPRQTSLCINKKNRFAQNSVFTARSQYHLQQKFKRWFYAPQPEYSNIN